MKNSEYKLNSTHLFCIINIIIKLVKQLDATNIENSLSVKDKTKN